MVPRPILVGEKATPRASGTHGARLGNRGGRVGVSQEDAQARAASFFSTRLFSSVMYFGKPPSMGALTSPSISGAA